MNRFDTNFKMERSKNNVLAKKGRKLPKRFFEKFWVEAGNLSNLGKLDQKSLFFILFFIDNG